MSRDLPKVELHLHLEGAAPPALVRDLAHRSREDISGIFDARGHYAYRDFAEFLKVYEAATSVIRTPEDYARLIRAVGEELAGQGVIYAETFVSPDFCGGGDLSAWRDFHDAMHAAADEVAAAGGPVIRGVVTAIRHFGPERSQAPALCAAETFGPWIRGFGMAGAEDVLEQKDFAWAFDCAREAGLGLTSHAGEWRGPDEVRAAIRDLGVTRIGHGVRAATDLALVDELAERGIVLEVCPGSNIALGIFPDWRRHPIGLLHERGVKVTVSTDDPPFFHTTMSREYDRLAEAFDWDAAEFLKLARIAAEAAFCDDATRTAILKQLETARCLST